MSNPAEQRDWSAYYHAMTNSPPRKTLLTALANFEQEATNQRCRKFAVDLGCGNGIDTQELLKAGWSVISIDQEAIAIEQLHHLVAANSTQLQTQVTQFNAL